MEGTRVNYLHHESKCRICFKTFGDDEHRVVISKLIEKKFREVTQTIVNKTHLLNLVLCFYEAERDLIIYITA